MDLGHHATAPSARRAAAEPGPAWAAIDSFAGNTTAADLLRPRDCPWCDGARLEPVVAWRGFQFFSDSAAEPKRADVRQVRCADCGGLFMSPVYTERGLAVLFAEAGCSFGAPADRYPARARWLLERARPAPGDTVLDVGCHEGRMLSQLPDTLHRLGVDLDAPSVARGRERFPALDLRVADASALDLARPPAVVSLFHVLEHLTDPVGVLAGLRGVAGPDTRLVVEVPVLESAVARDVVGFFTIHHVTHFTRESLVRLLARAGWETVARDAGDPNGFRVMARPAARADGAPVRPATPEGPAAARDFLARQQAVVDAVDARLAALDAGPAVMWGAGNHTEMLYQRTRFFRSAPSRPLALVDGDPAKQGTSWRGVTVHDPERVRDVDWRRTWLVVSSYGGRAAIAAAARERGVPAGRIVDPYADGPA